MPSFAPVPFTIGTTGVMVLAEKQKRIQYTIIYPSTAKVSGNTGIIYLGVGFVPNPTAGGSAAGHAMLPGDTYSEAITPGAGPRGLDDVSKEAIYLIASASGQFVEVIEVVQVV